MRKLSKKISMLMVLAMLVSLFSGIVSASAASAWSFKSAKYDVAVDETIEMEKNEYADFDLLKNDAAPTGYTVKWASNNPDVVWVNAKTGQLRADKFGTADLGDKATISATFTNTATKKSATRSFVIVVAEKAAYTLTTKVGEAVLGAEALTVGTEYALTSTVAANGKAVDATVAYTVNGAAVTALKFDAAGEYTVVATATVDGKVVATVKTAVVAAKANTAIVSAKQTSLSKALLVLGSETAAKAAADNNSVAVTFTAENSTYEIEALVKDVTVDANNKSAVVVEMFDQFVPKFTYNFAIGNESKGFVAVTAGEADIASISVVTWNKYIAESYNDLSVQVFNAQGIEITDSKEVKEYIDYYISWETVDADAAVDILNNQIQFFEANKSVVVKATLNMGYNDDGTEKIDLTAVGKLVSVPRYTDQPAAGFVINNATFEDAAHWDNNYTLGTIELIADEMPGKLVAKYTESEEMFGWAQNRDRFVIGGEDNGLDNKGGYTYRSSNDEVCFIDAEDGTVYPSKAGTARLYVVNPDGVAMGSVTVKVHAEQLLKNFTASLSKDKLSVDTVDEADSIVLTVNAKDQLGRNYDFTSAASIIYDLELSDNFGGKLTVGAPVADNGNYKFTITAADDAIADKSAKTTVIISAWDADDDDKAKVITRKVTFSLKDVNASEDGKVYLVSADKTVDTKLNQWGAGAYEVDLAAELRDGQTYFLDKIAYTMKNNGAASTVTGDYTLVVTKNNTTVDADEYTAFIGAKFTPVINDGLEVKKVSNGTYRFKLYVGTGEGTKLVDSLTVSVKDTTEKFSVVRNATNLAWYHNDINTGNLKDYLKLYRDGVLYDDWKYSVDDIVINPAKSVNGESIYVEEVTYKLGAFNEYFAYQSWSRAEYEYITVPVNMKFTIVE
jgi:hypothetical protein